MLRFFCVGFVGLFVLALYFTAMHIEEPFTWSNFLHSLLFNCMSFAIAAAVILGVTVLWFFISSSWKARKRKASSQCAARKVA